MKSADPTPADTRASATPSIRGLNLHVLNLHDDYTEEDLSYAFEWRISELPIADQYPGSMDVMRRVLLGLGVKDDVVTEYEKWDCAFAERFGRGLYTIGVRTVVEDLLSDNRTRQTHVKGSESKSRPFGGVSWAQTISQGLPPKSDPPNKGQAGGSEENDPPLPETPTPDSPAADRSSVQAVGPTRPCRLVFNPQLPLSPGAVWSTVF